MLRTLADKVRCLQVGVLGCMSFRTSEISHSRDIVEIAAIQALTCMRVPSGVVMMSLHCWEGHISPAGSLTEAGFIPAANLFGGFIHLLDVPSNDDST